MAIGATPTRGRWAWTFRDAPVAALLLFAAGGGVVIDLWWATTPAVGRTPGEPLIAAGRVLGLLSGYLVSVALVLMARIPVLERLLGADRLARWHAMIGRYVVWSIVAHATLITFGYAMRAHTGAGHQLITFWSTFPYVLMATAAFALFILVGVTSVRAARRRLAYETWYLVHLYGYLAIALAFAHQFANGGQFAGHRTNRLVWAAMYLTAATAVLTFRVLLPLARAFRHRLTVTRVVAESPTSVSIHLSGAHLAGWGGQAGQFVRLRFLTHGRWWQSHPYSLSAVPDGMSLRVTVKGVGDHTRDLARLTPGARVVAEGPYGAMTARRRTRQKVLLIAGGIGITPLRALFEDLQGGPADLTLLYRAAHEEELVFRSELDELAGRGQGTIRYLVGPREGTGSGDPLSRANLSGLLPDIAEHDVYVCGPPSLMASAIQTLRALGVPRRRIHTERFAL